jgi:ATP-dependent helicase HrpB
MHRRIMTIPPTPYPIEHLLPRLQTTLSRHPIALLAAKPGAGKTTLIPLALRQQPWLASRKIIILEPRRLAARAAARRMATLLGEPVGETIGYRTRLDTRIGRTTSVEVVTEGILTRILQHDPSLNEYGLVIFDEFHERSLQADLGLALTLQTRSLFRDDLRILIMSATLDARGLPSPLKEAPFLTCEGRMFPVETRYLKPLDPRNFTEQVAKTINRILLTEQGNLLVFLPGSGEIRKVEQCLAHLSLPEQTLVAPLYGDLPPQAQDQAILPPPAEWRKVVLSTNIAETSLTIEGIRIVLDTGLMRVPRFDPRSGMSRLLTLPVSQASADQRRGRAGRLGPGLCLRCWPESGQRNLSSRTPPEILDADLASLVLELAIWGIRQPTDLIWLDAPPPGTWAQGRRLLQILGALNHEGQVTEHGRHMADLPLHPRLAHMILQGVRIGLGPLACDLAAVLSERDLLKGTGLQGQADLSIRMEALYRQMAGGKISAVIHRMRQTSQMWQRSLGITPRIRTSAIDIARLGSLLACAYPDRIAQRQLDGSRRFKLVNGRMASFHHPDPLEQEEYLVIADLDGAQPVSRISLASPISCEDLLTQAADLLKFRECVEWNDAIASVIAHREQRLGELVLEVKRLPLPDPALVTTALLTGIQTRGLSCLPWTRELRHWQARVQFLRRVEGPASKWPDVSDDSLLNTLESWLAPYLTDMINLTQLQRLDLSWPLQAHLSAEQRRTLDTLAPTHLTVPTGSRIALDYTTGEIPILAVRLQELFGMTETPLIANGRVPVLIHLLSPARRPVQVTQDLKSFWKTGYIAVKKDLKGRYPKHFWPDDPLHAPPTRGVKKP